MPLPFDVLGLIWPTIARVINTSVPDPKTAVAATEQAFKALSEQQAELNAAIAATIQIQAETNKIEAQKASIFIAGWRPALAWVLVVACGYTFLAQPILVSAGIAAPTLDNAAIYALISGILGLGGLRSWEKKIGAARSNMKEPDVIDVTPVSAPQAARPTSPPNQGSGGSPSPVNTRNLPVLRRVA